MRFGCACAHITPLDDFVFGVGIFNAEGVCCYGTNTHIEGRQPHELTGDGEVGFTIDSLDLVAGTYKLDVAVHRRNGAPYDYHRSALYLPRDVASEGDRHLQPAAPVDVFGRHPHLWSVRTASFADLLSRQQAAAFAARVRARGGRVVFTNGVFDLLHPGHVRYLRTRGRSATR